MNYKYLEQKIIQTAQEGVTPMVAETIAAEFLSAQIQVSEELKVTAIKAKLLKSILKEERAKLLYKEATTPDKKPSDSILQAVVDKDQNVLYCQKNFDTGEEDAKELERLYDIFRESHIYYRGVSKGKFD